MTGRQIYEGFEQGPIRPPSESGSLLVRVTRNCPWNRCTFCGIYRGETFSRRPVDHVIRDIDTVRRYVDRLQSLAVSAEGIRSGAIHALAEGLDPGQRAALSAALNWLRAGASSVFLQDSNSLIIKPDDLVAILRHLTASFPGIRRITSYARARTVARISDDDLARIREAGLNRIHIGLESGSDAILARVNKGVDKSGHILAGGKVKRAGMELSEYWMPGLGGRELSRENALESADALNRIDPDFIRLRTLALPEYIELAGERRKGGFVKLGERETAEEILLFLESLQGISSMVKSDHILNLFEEVEGRLPEDRDNMTGVIRRFLGLHPEEQVLYMVGRRTGLFRRLEDLNDSGLRARAEVNRAQLGATAANVDQVMDGLLTRFI